MRSICWFRNDLRVLDNPALHNACLSSDEVIGVYLTTLNNGNYKMMLKQKLISGFVI